MTYPVSSFLLLVTLIIPSISQSQPRLAVAESGRYFVDQKQKPLFWQGDTQWELLHLFTVSEARALLTERKKQGFNVFQVMATGVYPEWGAAHGNDFSSPWDAWMEGDPSKPNEKYFERVDSIVRLAQEMNIILIVGIFHGADIDHKRITLENIKPWTKWLVSRYRSVPNFVWCMYPRADAISIPYIRKVIDAIRESGAKQLITMHPDPAPKSSSFMHDADWLSFNTLQSWHSGPINYAMVSEDYLRKPVKPVVNGEARYEEEDGTTDFETRRAGYWSYLAGGFYSYGHRDNWKSPLTWRKWVAMPGAGQIKIMGDVFRSLEWWKLVPDQSVFVQEKKGNAAARSRDNDWLLAYVTEGTGATVKLDKLRSSRVTVWWIDPVTGHRQKKGEQSTSTPYTVTLGDGRQDVLVLFQ